MLTQQELLMRILGDIHGQRQDYFKLIEGIDQSIQIGDLDFNYDWLNVVDPKRHRFFTGNHDCNELAYKSPHNLGDFGVVPGWEKAFFIRGGFSIDKVNRIPGIDWWADEQLSWEKLDEALELYKKVQPEILLSHECSLDMVSKITDGRVAVAYGFPPVIDTPTNITLQRMLNAHKPKMSLFAHYHRDFDKVIDGVRYVCITSDVSIKRGNKINFLDI
jgi:predicted phosphohydrolase